MVKQPEAAKALVNILGSKHPRRNRKNGMEPTVGQ